ncbi:hypothetical protein [Phyllobacterium chamaecytisi]|uniref:hypothetical protein n=1 Tax=Phyllobacterium chamaecytisi TaxID=2876082 RepID=UPI001CCB416D|nr:hypothetical protein [Phyllobacterium sp. KW56]MBZ9602984.1 hypothetical protein [Phyllobacterium sp. KW56]
MSHSLLLSHSFKKVIDASWDAVPVAVRIPVQGEQSLADALLERAVVYGPVNFTRCYRLVDEPFYEMDLRIPAQTSPVKINQGVAGQGSHAATTQASDAKFWTELLFQIDIAPL